MKIRNVVFNVFATLAVLPVTIGLARSAEQVQGVCPEAYVVYPEASHVVYPEGICSFDRAAAIAGI
jgi:hypothetical protein